MNKDKLNQELTELEARVAKIKEELSKPELKPFDYLGPYWIDAIGHVKAMVDYPGATRNALTEKGAEILAKQHRWQVLIQSLRDSLGCGDYEFRPDQTNCYIYYDSEQKRWRDCYVSYTNHPGEFYFPDDSSSDKVVDYLNEHYSEGFK